jgi:hypothetical protein
MYDSGARDLIECDKFRGLDLKIHPNDPFVILFVIIYKTLNFWVTQNDNK